MISSQVEAERTLGTGRMHWAHSELRSAVVLSNEAVGTMLERQSGFGNLRIYLVARREAM